MNIKKELKNLLRNFGINQSELYYLTGYHFNDVKTKEDFLEVKRLIESR